MPSSTAASSSAESQLPFKYFADYELLEVIAQGGMGIVYKARQMSLGRLVAVKMISSGDLINPMSVERFHHETEAVSRLDHANIVPIYDVGEESGVPYFVMKWFPGRSLQDQLSQWRLIDPASSAAAIGQDKPDIQAQKIKITSLVIKLAQAIHCAHQHGILHRDLKPANILLDAAGNPCVADFGLAKWMERESGLTRSRSVLGTPSFMAPEQAAGGTRQWTTAVDIYGLGAIYYQLLTGQPPFAGETELEILRKVQENDPKPPSRLNGSVDLDSETICLKCLAKNPSQRYASALALAEDLQRWLHGEPIAARPVGGVERVWRWCRRNPLLSGLSLAVALLLLLTASGSTYMAWHMKIARDQSEQMRKEATEKLWHSYLSQAKANRWSNRPGRRFDSLESLALAADIRPSLELRNEAIACMTLSDLRFGRRLSVPIFTGTAAVDATFERYVRGEPDGGLIVRRISDDEELFRLPGSGIWAWSAEFSPDGQFLACNYHPSDRDFPNEFRLWHLPSRSVTLTLSNTWGGAYFTPDDKHLLVHTLDAGSILFARQTLEEIWRVQLEDLSYPSSAFSHDGSWLAVPSLDTHVVRLMDIGMGEVLRTFPHPEAVRSVAWHPRRTWLATACNNGNLYLWDADAARLLATFRNHQMEASKVIFNHDGDLLLSASWDSTLRLWDVRRAAQILVMSVQYPRLHFSPDETLAGLVGVEDYLTLLEANTARECAPLRLEPGLNQSALTSGAFSPDGTLFAAGSHDGAFLWDLRRDRELVVQADSPVESLAFLPNGSGIVVCGESGVFLHDLEAFGSHEKEPGREASAGKSLLPGAHYRGLTLTSDGRRLAVAKYTSLRSTYPEYNLVLDLGSTNAPIVIQGPPNQGAAALSPDGHWLVTGIWRGKVISVWEVSTRRKVAELPVTDAAYYPKFSPDGRWLVAGTDEDFHCWEVGTWRLIYRLTPEDTLTSQPSTATFSPEGKMIAVFHRYNRTHLIDTRQGRLLATIDLDRHVPLCFSPGGGTLVMATEGGQAKFLDLLMIRKQLAEMNLDWEQPLPGEEDSSAK